jgi:hypothetical protein
MNYIYKLNGKTIKATNSVTGEPVVIAFAPFWFKPWSSTYQKLDAIAAYKDNYDRWLTSVERKEMNEHELHSAGFYKPSNKRSYEYQEYQNQAASYWKLKRLVLNAEKFEKNFEDAGVNHVVFEDNASGLKSNCITNIHKLNGSYYFDEQTPDFGTPLVGTLTAVKGKYIFTPKTETDANSGL